jgi:hypothetical protein
MRVKAAARAPFFHPFFFRAHRPPNSSSRLPAGFIFTLASRLHLHALPAGFVIARRHPESGRAAFLQQLERV